MLEEAQERFLTVIQENVCAPRSTKAANLILDAFTLKGDTAGLKNAAMEYQKKALDAQETCTGNRRGKGLASKEFNNEVGLIYESSSFTLIEETLKANNDQKMAAKSFWSFYEEFPSSQSADIALNNVAVYAFREISWPSQCRHGPRLTRSSPNLNFTPRYTFWAMGTKQSQITEPLHSCMKSSSLKRP